jgi:glycosyltransferase involved in cell wall biosynthesis
MAVVAALARALARDDAHVVAVASASPGAADQVEQDGPVTIYRLGIPRLPRARGQRTIRRKLMATAHDFRPTIIHAHGTGYYAAAAQDGFWPVILTAHGVVYEEAKRSGPLGWKDRLAWQYDARLEKKVLGRARRVIAISPYIRQAFADYPHLQWIDIPNPVADAFFDIRPQPQPGRLFTPARVIPRKGVDILIRAFAAIARDFPQATLRIAGENTSNPDFAAACRTMAAAAGIDDRVHFLGNLNRDALLREYANAVGVVLPARQETAPVAIEEALAAGCPVIATRVGGVPWMIEHERNGLLVAPADADALARALARLLSQEEDAAIWARNARLSAAPYRLDAVTTATLAAYRTLLPSH